MHARREDCNVNWPPIESRAFMSRPKTMSDSDSKRSRMATLNTGRTSDSAAAMTIQPERTAYLLPVATLPSKVSGHFIRQFSEAADAEDRPLIGLRKASDFIGLTLENCLNGIS